MAWVFLVLAILTEVAATLSLNLAAQGKKRWFVPVVLGYATAFTMLSLALGEGMPIGVAYGIWTACGVALTAVLGRVLFKDPLSWVMALGVALIAGGVILIEFGH